MGAQERFVSASYLVGLCILSAIVSYYFVQIERNDISGICNALFDAPAPPLVFGKAWKVILHADKAIAQDELSLWSQVLPGTFHSSQTAFQTKASHVSAEPSWRRIDLSGVLGCNADVECINERLDSVFEENTASIGQLPLVLISQPHTQTTDTEDLCTANRAFITSFGVVWAYNCYSDRTTLARNLATAVHIVIGPADPYLTGDISAPLPSHSFPPVPSLAAVPLGAPTTPVPFDDLSFHWTPEDKALFGALPAPQASAIERASGKRTGCYIHSMAYSQQMRLKAREELLQRSGTASTLSGAINFVSLAPGPFPNTTVAWDRVFPSLAKLWEVQEKVQHVGQPVHGAVPYQRLVDEGLYRPFLREDGALAFAIDPWILASIPIHLQHLSYVAGTQHTQDPVFYNAALLHATAPPGAPPPCTPPPGTAPLPPSKGADDWIATYLAQPVHPCTRHADRSRPAHLDSVRSLPALLHAAAAQLLPAPVTCPNGAFVACGSDAPCTESTPGTGRTRFCIAPGTLEPVQRVLLYYPHAPLSPVYFYDAATGGHGTSANYEDHGFLLLLNPQETHQSAPSVGADAAPGTENTAAKQQADAHEAATAAAQQNQRVVSKVSQLLRKTLGLSPRLPKWVEHAQAIRSERAAPIAPWEEKILLRRWWAIHADGVLHAADSLCKQFLSAPVYSLSTQFLVQKQSRLCTVSPALCQSVVSTLVLVWKTTVQPLLMSLGLRFTLSEEWQQCTLAEIEAERNISLFKVPRQVASLLENTVHAYNLAFASVWGQTAPFCRASGMHCSTVSSQEDAFSYSVQDVEKGLQLLRRSRSLTASLLTTEAMSRDVSLPLVHKLAIFLPWWAPILLPTLVTALSIVRNSRFSSLFLLNTHTRNEGKPI